jgi:hypothetical protein
MGGVVMTVVLPGLSRAADDAQEIGSLAVQHGVTAMRVASVQGTDGPLVYVEESPVLVGLQWRILAYGKKSYHRWWRLEVKVGSQASAIRSGHSLVMAQNPYSSTWVQRAPFKSPYKRERPTLEQHPDGMSAELIKWIEEELPYDFWETGNYLTAGISEPELPFQSLDAVRNAHETRWVFGVCADPAACEEALFASLEAQKWLKLTEEGTLRFAPPGVRLASLATIYDEMKDEAWSLMLLSIRQALAGPDPQSDIWLGQLVTKRVEQLYCNHLYNRYRGLTHEKKAG